MPSVPHDDADQTEAEIRSEQMQLQKAIASISDGRIRLRHQERRVADMHEPGTGTAGCRTRDEAERLATLMRGSLEQWERHRALIEQRLAYLHVRRARAEALTGNVAPSLARSVCASGLVAGQLDELDARRAPGEYAVMSVREVPDAAGRE
ncbi:hypothetical protein BRADO2289 [Bradyrhizobium sp. ORS 278]|uniref:hypothetical protein n=1 Tax=Bradyrhizobium sp. (strain ORS 278) TaxID=114615 RepID=UPI0001507F14|nr:hypothetical protein [Bradyrhizobium sp. ORS 278]CAL76124.1 hypothetical protein BRADO2289 [Bradyrhizobium sp. ORS 278]